MTNLTTFCNIQRDLSLQLAYGFIIIIEPTKITHPHQTDLCVGSRIEYFHGCIVNFGDGEDRVCTLAFLLACVRYNEIHMNVLQWCKNKYLSCMFYFVRTVYYSIVRSQTFSNYIV